MCSSHKPYRPGAFDFLAAYVIPEDLWYIIPAKEIRGLKSISLCTVGGEAKYELYREAWNLLRKASEIEDAQHGAAESAAAAPPAFPSSSAFGRMQAAGNFFRRYVERSNVVPPKREEKG